MDAAADRPEGDHQLWVCRRLSELIPALAAPKTQEQPSDIRGTDVGSVGILPVD